MSDIIKQKLWEILALNTSGPEADWLQNRACASPMDLMTAFVAAPRFLVKKIISLDQDQKWELNAEIPGFSVDGWSLVRLARVWLLTHLDPSDKEEYVKNIETLFDTAEMNELVALYSALPVLSYPDQWLFRATDAVRSNMGFVFDAIALHNPYPEKYFSELAWNQLVLKTIFNDKPIHFIEGLENRANEKLAMTLSDFAHERWAAGRSVPAQVWRLAGKFMNPILLADMQHLLDSENVDDHRAAALACNDSSLAQANYLLAKYIDLEKSVKSGALTWADLEH
ncbi:EboA domain-containing protein [Dyadobacter fanqingshengii]|uniref:EboA domain-containing protein n=1 Tax=Dyadobacter fanqingshengii TaxID=2906443 RepID=A0A9X1PFS2_9BACT|nr:EboA domain-containing protein [Dyadobacter fanqingshengii]MCF0043289.1 EboA domain-containing protein [Dyadobacter fanqingshengii]USJ35762.1 EboA domain-containing protein [Dyadobacter fanqingshengii]